MKPRLFEGDIVIINKLAYGARLPVTPLNVKSGGRKKYLEWIVLPYLRIPGFSSIKRNDIVAFNYSLQNSEPVDMQEEFIKRCVGLPGDSIELIDGSLYANKVLVKNKYGYRRYNVVFEVEVDSSLLRRSGIELEHLSEDKKSCTALMTDAQRDSIAKTIFVKMIRAGTYPSGYYHPSLYPNHSEFKWNYDHFGPLWIPKKGDSILLTKNNLILYQRCIEVYERTALAFKGDTVLINNKPARYYTFKLNYYFMLGDNLYNSIDSRVSGLIAEDHILGKASFILYSSSRGDRRFLSLD